MGALAALVLWAGYSVFALGLATVRGYDVTWSELSIPGRFTGATKFASSSTGNYDASTQTATSATKTGAIDQIATKTGTLPNTVTYVPGKGYVAKPGAVSP